jgi:hypothetical protein
LLVRGASGPHEVAEQRQHPGYVTRAVRADRPRRSTGRGLYQTKKKGREQSKRPKSREETPKEGERKAAKPLYRTAIMYTGRSRLQGAFGRIRHSCLGRDIIASLASARPGAGAGPSRRSASGKQTAADGVRTDSGRVRNPCLRCPFRLPQRSGFCFSCPELTVKKCSIGSAGPRAHEAGASRTA